MHIVIVPISNRPGKLADAEVHFTEGLLAGAKLVGFSIWESKWANGALRVTVPSREYEAGGERRRFDLLRPVDREHDQPAIDALRDAILDAFAEQDGGIEQATQVAREVARAAAARPAPRAAATRPQASTRSAAPTVPAPRQAPQSSTRRPSAPRYVATTDDVPF